MYTLVAYSSISQDGAEEGQEFQLWNLGKTFDSTKFYTKMLPIEEGADTGIVAGGSSGFDDLLERVRRKQFKKRVVSRQWCAKTGVGVVLEVLKILWSLSARACSCRCSLLGAGSASGRTSPSLLACMRW